MGIHSRAQPTIASLLVIIKFPIIELICKKNQHHTLFNTLAKIREIDDVVIIINNAVADVIEHKCLHHTNGTYLLIFEDEININGSNYVNLKGIPEKIRGLPDLPTINVTYKYTR